MIFIHRLTVVVLAVTLIACPDGQRRSDGQSPVPSVVAAPIASWLACARRHGFHVEQLTVTADDTVSATLHPPTLGALLARHALATLGYCILAFMVSYFFLKSREIAA